MKRALLVLALALGGCTDWLVPGPMLPEGAVRMAERPEFAALWDEVTACLGDKAVMRDRSRIGFYYVPGQDTIYRRENGKAVWGLYFERAHIMVFPDFWSEGTAGAAQPYYYRDPIIRHEFIHAQTTAEGHPAWVLPLCGHLIHTNSWHD